MTIVFDLDYTLLDTVRFKEDLAVAEQADHIVCRTGDYLFEGAVDMLEDLKRDGHDLHLLTLGDVTWQKKKVVSAGLEVYFSQVLYAPEDKMLMRDALESIDGLVVMVNDNGKEIDALQRALPEVKMVAVRGPKPLPADSSIPVCKNLKEVYQEIRNIV